MQTVLTEVNPQSHIMLKANLCRDQQKLVKGLIYNLSSYQVHCTVMIFRQMATDLHTLGVAFLTLNSWGSSCRDAWTAIPQNGCCRACSCRALAAIFSTNSHTCVLHPNSAPENDADTIWIYIQISKNTTTLKLLAKNFVRWKAVRVFTVDKIWISMLWTLFQVK